MGRAGAYQALRRGSQLLIHRPDAENCVVEALGGLQDPERKLQLRFGKMLKHRARYLLSLDRIRGTLIKYSRVERDSQKKQVSFIRDNCAKNYQLRGSFELCLALTHFSKRVCKLVQGRLDRSIAAD